MAPKKNQVTITTYCGREAERFYRVVRANQVSAMEESKRLTPRPYNICEYARMEDALNQ